MLAARSAPAAAAEAGSHNAIPAAIHVCIRWLYHIHEQFRRCRAGRCRMPRTTEDTMKPFRLAVLVAAVQFVFAPASFAFNITIDNGFYSGRYFVSGYSTQFSGPTVLNLGAGSYTIDNGSGIGGSAFGFDVDMSGTVTNIVPAAAATASGGTLTFNHVTVDVMVNN